MSKSEVLVTDEGGPIFLKRTNMIIFLNTIWHLIEITRSHIQWYKK